MASASSSSQSSSSPLPLLPEEAPEDEAALADEAEALPELLLLETELPEDDPELEPLLD